MRYSLAQFSVVISHVSEERDWGNKVPPVVGENQVQDHLSDLKINNSTGSNKMQLSMRDDSQWLNVQVESSNKWCPSRVHTGTDTI